MHTPKKVAETLDGAVRPMHGGIAELLPMKAGTQVSVTNDAASPYRIKTGAAVLTVGPYKVGVFECDGETWRLLREDDIIRDDEMARRSPTAR